MTVPYISEVNPRGAAANRFIEVRVDEGTDTSNMHLVFYDVSGNALSTIGLGTVNWTENGNDIYLSMGADSPLNTTGVRGYALTDGTDVLQFISLNGAITATNGLAAGHTSTSYAAPPSGSSLQSDDVGQTYYVQSVPNPGHAPPVCFAPGTLIDTPDGPRAVEALCPGALVNTLDHGPQAIRWTHCSDHPLENAWDEAKPVLINAGALGRNLPAQDLIVSPQHRILVGSGGQLEAIFAAAALVPAKALTSLPGIRHMKGKRRMTWFHFACDRHEVVFANGCLSESLLLGPMVMNGLTLEKRRTLLGIFGSPEPSDAALNGQPARQCLRVGDVRRRLAECPKEITHSVPSETRKWDRDHAMELYEAQRLVGAMAKNRTRDETRGAAGASN